MLIQGSVSATRGRDQLAPEASLLCQSPSMCSLNCEAVLQMTSVLSLQKQEPYGLPQQAAVRQNAALTGTRHAGKHPLPHLTNLVVVAAHAVFTGFDFTQSEDPANWLLLDYQKVDLLHPIDEAALGSGIGTAGSAVKLCTWHPPDIVMLVCLITANTLQPLLIV